MHYCLLIILLATWIPCSTFQVLTSRNGYSYSVYEPADCIPLDVLKTAEKSYFEMYDSKLHEGLTLEEMQINPDKFSSYEEFIADMFQKDFESYAEPNLRSFFLVHDTDETIVAICALLHQGHADHYYIDHIGVSSLYQGQGIGTELVKQVKKHLSDYSIISLDTRIFNTPAQAFYEKLGFQRVLPHPHPLKTRTYYHYVLNH